MGEVRPLTADGGADESGFEPEITWRTAEGAEYTLRLDFGICREIHKKFNVDLLARTFSWSDLKMERWPEMVLLLTKEHHPDLTVQSIEKFLHPRNATLLVRRWQDLWGRFNASDNEELERAFRSIASLADLEFAPAEVREHAQELAKWISGRLNPPEDGGSPSPEGDEEPTG